MRKEKFNKTLLILLVILCLICALSSLGAGKYCLRYVAENDPESALELTDFNFRDKTALINVINATYPKYGIKNYSKDNVTLEIYRKWGKELTFRIILDGKKVIGKINYEKNIVKIDNVVYKKV
ncbi:MAG: hypothetical protein QM214_01340 [Bacillota bacterium]|jgi:hypothetical protein|nr:hypothetical protein [Bacillota bacterium]HHU43286.1 hypothetical protein [Clostridiales bacterium]